MKISVKDGNKMNEQEQTIDLKILFKVLMNHLVPIIIATIMAGAVGFVLAYFVIPKQYTAEALLYVENSSNKDSETINVNDISAAQKLVNTCQILFTSEYVLDQLVEELDYGWSVSEVRGMINVASVNSTEVLKISVVTNSKSQSVTVANKLVELSQAEFNRVIKNGSIEVVSSATYPERHTYPKVSIFTAAGLFIGLFGSYVIFLLAEMLDNKVKEDDDLAQIYGIPVFAEIMDFESANRSNYKYESYGGKSK